LASEREKRADLAEAVRLTYVASTRARDHLILSLWRKEAWSEDPPAQAAGFEESVDSGGIGLRVDLEAAVRPLGLVARPLPQPSAEQHREAEAAWLVRRSELVQALGGLRLTTATGLAREADPDLESDDVAILRRGRGGTSFGRAVHAVLQVVPLETLAGLDELARGQAAAEGIGTRGPEGAGAVRRASGSAPGQAAIAAARYWREVPLGAAADGEGTVLEGFVDLLYPGPAGLRVVDYKTDNASQAEIERRFTHYRLQGGAYALLLQLATGQAVAGVDFVFSSTGEVRSIEGPELAALVAEVRSRLGEGAAAEQEEPRDTGRGGQRQPEGEPVATAQPAEDDAADDGEGDGEGGQLQLSWTAGSEEHE